MPKFDLSEYDFNLPKSLIAQKPASPRDHARLLIFNRKTKKITDDYFYNLETYLEPYTTLVLNNSKVEKSRLKINKFEIFITKAINEYTVEALVYPGKKFKCDQTIKLSEDLSVKVEKILSGGQRVLTFSCKIDSPRIKKLLHTPFPPYIKADEKLSSEYQTVYSKFLGSKAAPTAGLHFTSKMMAKLKQNYHVAEVTLHVGLGTFAPLKPEYLKSNKLHQEYYEINDQTVQILNSAKHITALGTTTVRTLESAIKLNHFTACSSSTDIFIKPGYKFSAVDNIITNFHLPRSSLIMLVSAFAGIEETKLIYNHAIKQKYRFYSFGDCMLIK